MNDLWVFDTTTLQWCPEIVENIKGNSPHYRAFHTSTMYKDMMIVFGGAICDGGPYKYYNDIHTLNVKTMVWKKIQCKGAILGRSQHTSVVLGNIMIVIGGYDGHNIFDDVYLLNLNTFTWKQVKTNDCLSASQGITPQVFRISPARRPGFTFGRRIIVVDQLSSPPRLCCLNTTTWEWRFRDLGFLGSTFVFIKVDNMLLLITATKTTETMSAAPLLDCLEVPHPKENKLGEDMLMLLHSDSFKDITFNVQGKKLMAHKCILFARCPYFKAMFQSGLSESNAREIKINEASYEAFKIMLEFLYAGNTNVSLDAAPEVLMLADKYVIPELKNACEYKLFKMNIQDNVFELFKLSEILSVPLIEEACLDFIISNWDLIAESTEFQSLDIKIKERVLKEVSIYDSRMF